MSDNWDDIADWWLETIAHDAGDSDDLLSLLADLIDRDARTIDLGCGEGQALPLLGDLVVGVDRSHRLLVHAVRRAPVVCAELPGLSWVRPASFDQAVAVGFVEMIADHVSFFQQTAQVVRPGGTLVVVMNHPVSTTPDSEPLVDDDGGVLWYWGRYLDLGATSLPAAQRTVELYHRPLGELLNAAAAAGWHLDHVIERGSTPHTLDTLPDHHGHEHIPSLLGVRWRRGQQS